jgi:hypothetical protein
MKQPVLTRLLVFLTPIMLIACAPKKEEEKTDGTTTNPSTSVAAPTNISYSQETYTLVKGIAISSQTPTLSGGTPSSCTISPALPSGLSLSSVNCAISGTPSVTAASAQYQITASNSAGSISKSIFLSIVDSQDFSAHSVSAKSGLDGSVELTWLAPTIPSNYSLASFSIYRDTSSGFTPGPGNLLASVASSTLAYTDNTVSNNTKYYFKIVAIFTGNVAAASSLESNALPLAAAAGADANNVFISPSGNNTTGNGSIGNPYQTLARAVTAVSSGGTIFVNDGTYSISGDYTISKPVTIRSLSGDYRTSAAVFVESPTGTTRAFTIANSNTSLQGLEMVNISMNISNGLSDISFKNNYVRDLKIRWMHYTHNGILNFLFHGNYFKNIGDRTGAAGYSSTASGFNYWPSTSFLNLNNVFSYNTIENPAWSGFQILRATGLRVLHNTITTACDSGMQYNPAGAISGDIEYAFNNISSVNKAGSDQGCKGSGLLLYNSANYQSSVNFSIHHNSISTSDKGIDFAAGTCSFTANPNLQIYANNIQASNAVGFDFNTCVGNLNISNNYWGHSSGPNGNSNSGTGASINLGTATGTLTSSPFAPAAF